MSGRWRVVTACLAIALAAYFIWFLIKHLDTKAILTMLSSPTTLVAVLIASLLYASIIPITAWAWRGLLLAQQENWPSSMLARILGLTQLAKYIPGNVAQHATRAALSIRAGMNTRVFLASLAQETLLAVAASLIIGLMMLALSARGLDQLSPFYFSGLLMLGAFFGVLVLLLAAPKLAPERLKDHENWLSRMLLRLGGLPGPRATLRALGGYSANYLLIGIGLWLVAWAIGLSGSLDLALVTSAFALSWVLGFLAPGAPAGLGAREGIMLLLLHGSAPDDELAAFVLLARVVTMLGDGICFALANVSHYRAQQAKGESV